MRSLNVATNVLLLVFGVSLPMGCTEKSTCPESKPPPPPGEHLWSKRFGDGQDWQVARSVAVDALGNVILAGDFAGTVDFGGGPLTSASGLDIFVAKLGADASHIWSKRFGDVSDQYGDAVAVDRMGNVVLAGSLSDTVDFGGGPLACAGGYDIFVAKFASDGAHLWSKRFGDGDYQWPLAVAVDASGNVILAGYLRGTVDFGGGALTSAGTSDIFVAKLASDGAHLWSKRFGDVSDQYGDAVAVDRMGNVVLAGDFEGALDFGGGELACQGGTDVFVAKLGSDGSHLWSKRFGGPGTSDVKAVAVDPMGNMAVAGCFNYTVDFGGGVLTSAGSHDIFVAKLAPDGTHVWSKRFGDADYQMASGVAVDALGNVILAGDFAGTVDFGGDTLTSVESSDDIFVAKLAFDGTHLWSKRFGDGRNQLADPVAAVDATRNVIVAGCFVGAVDFGGGALTSAAGGRDIFLAKFGL